MLLRLVLNNLRCSATNHSIKNVLQYSKCILAAGDVDFHTVSVLKNFSVNYSSRGFAKPPKHQPIFSKKDKELSEKDIQELCTDPDSFGTLSTAAKETHEQNPNSVTVERPLKEENSIRMDETKLLENYSKQIEDSIKSGDVQEAVNLFEQDVLAKDGLHPPVSMFQILFDASIRFDMPKQAFKMCNHMSSRQLPISLEIIQKTVLCCGMLDNSVKEMKSLRKTMERHKLEPNAPIHNAIIRNYFRSAEWRTGFQLLEHIKSKGFEVEHETLQYILEGCSYDKINGFNRAIQLWHELQHRNVTVNIFILNALLKCVHKCSITDVESLVNTSNEITAKYNERQESVNAAAESDDNSEIKENPRNDGRPNLLHKPPIVGHLLPLESVTTPQHRLLLLGGFSEISILMKTNGITPTMDTIMLLLNVVPNTKIAEIKLFGLLKKYKIESNTDFYHKLLQRICVRHDYEAAKEIINRMYEEEVEMDMIAFGLLGISCKSDEEAAEYLSEMNHTDSRPNIDILNGMLTNASRFKDNNYVIRLLRYMQDMKIEPTIETRQLMDEYTKEAFTNLRRHHLPDKRNRNEFFKLSREHKQWLKTFSLDEPRVKDPRSGKSDVKSKNIKWRNSRNKNTVGHTRINAT